MNAAELAAAKAQLEANLEDLRRELEQSRRQVTVLQAPGASDVEGRARASALLEQAQRTALELERRKLQIQRLDEQLRQAQTAAPGNELPDLQRSDQTLKNNIAALRLSLLASLRALAGPLRRYQALAERKTAAASRLTTLTRKDRSYANYLDCALVRRQEFDDDLRFVLETLQKARVVS